MCCLKIIFLVVNASNLIIKIPFERKLKNAKNKIYLLAKVSYFLKNDIVKLQNTEKTEFSLTSAGTSQSHDVKDFFLKHVYIYYIISLMNLANIRICMYTLLCYFHQLSAIILFIVARLKERVMSCLWSVVQLGWHVCAAPSSV